MGKRSRDVSSSSPEQVALSESHTPVSQADTGHIDKMAAIDNLATDRQSFMKCDLPPHPSTLEFPSIEAFEIHYAQDHTNRCSSCGKNLPSAHFLNLHIDENHNPVREALAAKGEKTYACLLPECERKCSTPAKRRLHVVDKHHFAKFYNFRVIDHGIDDATSLLREGRRRRVSMSTHSLSGNPLGASQHAFAKPHEQYRQSRKQAEKEADRVSEPALLDHTRNTDTNNKVIDELEASFSAMTFVPRSVAARQSHR